MIKSFGDKETQRIYARAVSTVLPNDIQKRAKAKLDFIHAATSINDLRVPPANHLKQLKGDREGAYSIRINEQWRITFLWIDGHAHEVTIEDYH